MDQTLYDLELYHGGLAYFHKVTQKPNNLQHVSYTNPKYQLFYLISGQVSYQIEDETYELQAGDLLLFNNKEMHRPFFHSEETYERIIIFFTPGFINRFNFEGYRLLKYFDNKKPGAFNLLKKEQLERIQLQQDFVKIENYIVSGLPQDKIRVELTFIDMLIKINSIIEAENEPFTGLYSRDEKIEQIIDFLNKQYAQNLRLEDIEQRFFINKFYFSHQFKKITGVNFKDYLIKKRISKASELLKLDYKPSEIARLVGFEDYSNFYKAFRRIEGVAPSNYRKDKKEKDI
jgi:AraC-like DNA-binding protein